MRRKEEGGRVRGKGGLAAKPTRCVEHTQGNLHRNSHVSHVVKCFPKVVAPCVLATGWGIYRLRAVV